jgi:glycosyltransferase involved in cell wall biosynthesis/GT2 family glycosyltransferase
MRIGIDLGPVMPGECGGIVPLLKGVLNALFAGPPSHEFALFCNDANVGLFPNLPPAVELLILPGDRFFSALDRETARRNLDVLFRSFPTDDSLGLPLARQVVLIPDLQHEFFPEFFAPEVLHQRSVAFNKVLAGAGAIGTLSEHARRTILAHPCTRCRDVFLMSPGSPLDVSSNSIEDLMQEEQAQLPAGDFFLYPANLWPHKNHRRLLQAFDLFQRRTNHRCELVLTGHPEGWPELSADFPHLPVRHLGYVRRGLLQVLLRRARALVFFSLYEGFGMPLLEAFHAGTPVVCSNATSLPEVGGDAVLTCDPMDTQAMSELLLRVAHDEALRADLTTRGKARLARYAWHDSARNLLEAYGRVAASAPTQRRTSPMGKDVARRFRSGMASVQRKMYTRFRPLLGPMVGVLRQHPPRPLVLPSRRVSVPAPRPTPVISIVTPSYNQADFLERTIRSVLEQDYPRLEYIVQDGGSPDGTVDVLRRHAETLTRWESIPDRGQAHALNLGFRHATGEILAYLNSDDLLLPGALDHVARYFTAHPEVDVVYSHRVIIDPDDQEVGRWVLPPHDDEVLSWQDYVPQETLFWRRSIWERSGGRMDESFHFALDWDLLLRFREAGARFARLPRFLGAFRIHPRQKTSALFTQLYYPEIRRLRERCHGRPVPREEIRRALRPYLRRQVLYHQLYRMGLLGC